MVVDLPAPFPPERVVTSSSRSKVLAKKPFQLTSVSERNLPRSIIIFLRIIRLRVFSLIIELQGVFDRHRFPVADHAQLRFARVVAGAHVSAKTKHRFG